MTQWKSPSTAVNLTLIQSLPLSATDADSHLRSEAAPSKVCQHVHPSYPDIFSGRLTVAHIVAHSLPNSIFALVPKLVRILKVLRYVPHIISNHPSGVADFFEEALGLLCPLLERRSKRCAGKRSKTEEFETAHVDFRRELLGAWQPKAQQRNIYLLMDAPRCRPFSA